MLTAPKIDLERFYEEGYLVVEDVLDPERDLQPTVDEYMELLETLTARWHAEGTLSSTYAELPFAQRMARVLSEMGMGAYQHFDIALPLGGTLTNETPIHVGAATFGLLTNPRLLDVVEQIIGAEIYSNPIQHVRIKPPEQLLPNSGSSSLVTATDWHQDQGVALPEIDESDVLTVWLPVTDATEENGCMRVIPRSHMRGLVTHCSKPGKGFHIPDTLLAPDPIAVPMRRGSLLLIQRRTMHASLRNVSDGVRWSFDLRYQPTGTPTGRPMFPGFVARSRINPASELRDPHTWAQLWYQARARIVEQGEVGQVRRWTGNEPACA